MSKLWMYEMWFDDIQVVLQNLDERIAATPGDLALREERRLARGRRRHYIKLMNRERELVRA